MFYPKFRGGKTTKRKLSKQKHVTIKLEGWKRRQKQEGSPGAFIESFLCPTISLKSFFKRP